MKNVRFFIYLIRNVFRRLTCAVFILLLSVVTAFAADSGQVSDTVYTFRFYRGSTKLFVPVFGNDSELARLEECVKSHIDDIRAGHLPLYVDGYCDTYRSDERNLEIARGRSNRVKSELITRQGLKEEHFITKNHTGGQLCCSAPLCL